MKIKKIRKYYRILNDLYFDNMLPEIKISTGYCGGVLGVFSYHTEETPFYTKPKIKIDLTNQKHDAIVDTLLHEMIHFWQYLNELPLDHGKMFYKKARQIYRMSGFVLDYGRHLC